jgi:hypothetical protein
VGNPTGKQLVEKNGGRQIAAVNVVLRFVTPWYSFKVRSEWLCIEIMGKSNDAVVA